jgi:hypothetical protein
MGLSLGGTNSSSTSSGSNSNTYTAGQTSLQNSLMTALSQLLPAASNGSLSPNVQNTETANANSINQQYSQVGQNMNRYLAARGFGQSGSTGQAALQTELGRQGALAANESSASGQQLSLDSTLLSDSLQAAFNSTGSTSSGATSGSSSNWGTSLAAAFSV